MPREPAKTKAELREMLAQVVRNTQPELACDDGRQRGEAEPYG